MTCRIMKNLFCVGTAIAVLTGMALSVCCLPATATGEVPVASSAAAQQGGGYDAYRAVHDISTSGAELRLPAAMMQAVTAGVTPVSSLEGKENVLRIDGEEQTVTVPFTVAQSGWYAIEMTYLPLESNLFQSEIGLKLDGQTPYKQAERIVLTRPWKDDGEPVPDKQGNEIRADQTACSEWQTTVLRDQEGRYNEALGLWLEVGAHTLTLQVYTGDIALYEIRLRGEKTLPTYAQRVKEYRAAGYQEATNVNELVESEDYAIKSDSTILADYDKSDALTQPSSAKLMLLNYIPGGKFQNAGEWVTWQVTVPQDGLYRLSLRYRQNGKNGAAVYRRLYIDGEVPFAECDQLAFPSDSRWCIKTLGNEDGDFLFYLTAGPHDIKLEVVPGATAGIMRAVDDAVLRLNTLYRKALMAVGTTNDTYRDYQLDSVPGLKEEITALKELMTGLREDMIAINGKSGSELSSFQTLINLLTVFDDETDKLATMREAFRSAIESLSAWNLGSVSQPLDLDYVLVTSPEQELPRARANFFEGILFELKRWLVTYRADYGTIGEQASEGALEVWITTFGRDQLQIMKDLVDNDFTGKQNIDVNLSLVSAGINEAVLAGKAPDVGLFLTGDRPVNFAIRGAVENLSGFDTFDEVSKRFVDGTMEPFTYKGGCYGLPLTETFNMMFVRTDIFEELGLEIPRTWEDLYEVATVLQRNNMEIGIPATINMFSTILLQSGESFYSDDLTRTNFHSEKAVDAFTVWTDYFTQYDFPLEYNFYNRFRSGEMPIGIAPYTYYTMFENAAPEIKGLWVAGSVPGTVREDGSIDTSLSICEATGRDINPGLNQSITAAVIFDGCTRAEDAWAFLDWLTSGQTQTDFGLMQEAILGSASRYSPANMEAFKNLPWNAVERETILAQWASVKTLPEVPGSYYVARNLNNAFRKVVNERENPTDMLNRYNLQINKELERKATEFGD